MKNFITSLILVSLTSLSHAFASDLNEAANFIEQVANENSIAITLGADDPVFLGRILNSSTGEGIEIGCSKGTREKCETIGFYRVNGVREAKPYLTLLVGEVGERLHQGAPYFQFARASAWIISPRYAQYRDQRDLSGTWIPPVTIAPLSCILVDVILTPYSLIKYLVTKKSYKKARTAIMNALSTGGSITVSDREFKRISDILVNLPR